VKAIIAVKSTVSLALRRDVRLRATSNHGPARYGNLTPRHARRLGPAASRQLLRRKGE